MVSRRLKTIVLCTIRWESSIILNVHGGIRWDDPAIGIVWPIPAGIISVKDQNYVDFEL